MKNFAWRCSFGFRSLTELTTSSDEDEDLKLNFINKIAKIYGKNLPLYNQV